MTNLIPPIPAATLVIFRERVGAAPEILMVERAAAMAFAGGAMVFPGGRIDPEDYAFASSLRLDPVGGPAAIAAIRETIEEVGIAIGIVPPLRADVIAEVRAGLAKGLGLTAALKGTGSTLDTGALIPFARWRPNMRETRVFDTHFFIARAPFDALAEADGAESMLALWTTAEGMLNAASTGRRRIIFPTQRNLERLAQFASFQEACEHALSHPVEVIEPYIEERDGVRCLCIPDGLGYPITAVPLHQVQRG